MRTLLTLLVCGALFRATPAPVPANDARNTEIPNTDTHFTAPSYQTLSEWQARRAHLRPKILSAAGLLPPPPQNPLHPQIFGRIENRTYSIALLARLQWHWKKRSGETPCRLNSRRKSGSTFPYPRTKRRLSASRRGETSLSCSHTRPQID